MSNDIIFTCGPYSGTSGKLAGSYNNSGRATAKDKSPSSTPREAMFFGVLNQPLQRRENVVYLKGHVISPGVSIIFP
jgi:hypothetical protein